MTRTPTSTYRVQFSPSFGFADFRPVLAYLAELGVSHIYASPVFRAKPGSSHGYDVCDHQSINPELGGEEEFLALSAEARRLGLGWVQDIVPNHMALSGDNPLLADVLENGPASRYATFFDIDWDHPNESFRGRMLAPFLGGFYGRTLENGEIRVIFDQGGFSVRYYDLKFPLRIDTYPAILTRGLERLRRLLGPDAPDYVKLLGILYNIKSLPPEPTAERYDQIYFIKQMLAELVRSSRRIREFVDSNLDAVNGETEGEGEDRFALLENLLAEQFFRLSYWKVAGAEINYRRFFSVNNLISLRVEREEVFQNSHRKILDLTREGAFSGLRVDHIDGLYDPSRYLRRLREQAGDAYIVVEKVLIGEEELPTFWPVSGTTGYDFLNLACGLFTDHGRERAFERIYASFVGLRRSPAEVVEEKKRRIIENHMHGDVENMARLVNAVSSRDRQGFDITLRALKLAITEVLVHFPVYRTYISPDAVRPADAACVRSAVRQAKRSAPDLAYELDFMERFLLLQYREGETEERKDLWTRFAMRFQQVTGPLMAKGVEDTAFYVLNRLLCLNEVGGAPGSFGLAPEDFHQRLAERARQWPSTMNATSTHDTKRGEDARMRLAALSEMPERWRTSLSRFARLNQRRRRRIEGGPAPDRNEEYFFYQSLLGSWPCSGKPDNEYLSRLRKYLVKALREAKAHSSWLTPDMEYEAAVQSFAEALLRPAPRNLFLKEFQELALRVSEVGYSNSLAQLVLKLTAPGVPDIYQGTEFWDLSFVDPDNRRPVDFGLLGRTLAELKTSFAANPARLIKRLLARPEDGRIKLFTLWRGLSARRARPALCAGCGYAPLRFAGRHAERAVGFFRSAGQDGALAVVPRLTAALTGPENRFALGRVWDDTRLILPFKGRTALTEAMTGRRMEAEEDIPLRDLLADFPVALLLTEAAD